MGGIKAFAEAGTGLAVVDGKLIEKLVLREMQRIVSVAQRASRIKSRPKNQNSYLEPSRSDLI